jgi:casein kinase II subunit beta
MSRNTQQDPQYRSGGAKQSLEEDDDSNATFDSNEDDDEEIPWIMWFCSLKGNEFFCEVDEEFIQDEFNLTGLASMVPFYDNAIDMILDLESPGEEDLTEEQQHMVETAAETLYGLIHARFITTHRGLKLMEEKYKQYHFGRCPRVFCGGQAVLPVGQSDVVRESSVKVFCPKCEDIYYPRSSRHKALDGAFWGTTFPHLLLLQLQENSPPVAKNKQIYMPRIFGFRVRRKDAQEQTAAIVSGATSTSTDIVSRQSATQSKRSGKEDSPTVRVNQLNTTAQTAAPAGSALQRPQTAQ